MTLQQVRPIVSRVVGNRWQVLLFCAATILVFAVAYYAAGRHNRAMRLTSCLSYGRSTPGPLANLLADEANKRGLQLDFVRATGSEATLAALAVKKLDVAMIRSGIAREMPEIRQIATGNLEVVHVFVRGDVCECTPAALRGKRVAIGRPASETRTFTETVLKFMGLTPNVDFVAVELQPDECAQLSSPDLPDVVFDVAPLPSVRGEMLARMHGYRLVDLPLGEALHLRDRAFEEIVVPPSTYCVLPAIPEKPVRTVGCRLIFVARSDVPAMAVKALLGVLFDSDFARRAGMPPMDPQRIAATLDCPLHPGASAYLERNRPLIRAEMLENVQGVQGIFGTTTCGVLLAWGWLRRRGAPGVDRYPQLLAEIELEAIRLAGEQGLSNADRRALWRRLATMREELLEHVAARRVAADANLTPILERFAMVEESLTRLSDQQLHAVSEPLASRFAA